jgi:hypothetical protein
LPRRRSRPGRGPSSSSAARRAGTLEEIELLKEQHARRGLSFASLTEEELAQKIRGETSKSPFFYWQGWTAATTPGNAAYIEVGYRNPDPIFWQICVTMFFGLANFAADITATLAGRHTGWPYVSDVPTIVSAGGTAPRSSTTRRRWSSGGRISATRCSGSRAHSTSARTSTGRS